MIFAFGGNIGAAILFVLSLALWAALLGYTVLIASQCYEVVIQGTVAGIDRVKWPDDPMIDRIPQAVTLTALVAIWLAPVGILSRALGAVWLPGHGIERFIILAAPVFWFCFPLSLLSSLGSSSRWQILNGRVLLGLLRLTPSLLIFYPVTAAMLAVIGLLSYYGLFSPVWYVWPIAAVLGSAALMIHARLVGRLGWQLQQLQDARKKSQRSKRRTKPSSRAVTAKNARENREEDDDAVPSGPRVRVVERPEPKAPRPHYMDPEPEPFALAETTPEEEPTPVPPQLELNQAQIEREIELRSRKPPNPPPTFPMFSGVWTFPFYDTTASALILLACFSAATGLVFRFMMSVFQG